MYNLIAYGIYLSLALITVLFVGHLLFKNGRFFLIEVFDSSSLADNINRVLYLGYCLVNSGCAFYHLNTVSNLNTVQELIEFLFGSTGQLYLILGLMHFANLLVIPRLKPFLKTSLITNLKKQKS
jgi:hypothetical protein